MENEFVPFTEDYDYEKAFYDVLLEDGAIVKHCWPNNGTLVAMKYVNRVFTHKDKIKVRLSLTHPLEDRE